jgi:F0F1-type ATP synthase assembly protein I
MLLSHSSPADFAATTRLNGAEMEEDKKRLFRALGMVSSMGISVVVAIAIGVFVGLQLDKWFGTKHLFFYIFLFFGIAAGFRNIYIIAGREIRDDDQGEDKRR